MAQRRFAVSDRSGSVVAGHLDRLAVRRTHAVHQRRRHRGSRGHRASPGRTAELGQVRGWCSPTSMPWRSPRRPRSWGAGAVPTDVSDTDEWRALAAAAPDADLVCLNAGIVGTRGSPCEVPPADWDTVFAVNLGGVVNGLRVFVPPMLASGRPSHVRSPRRWPGSPFPGDGAYGRPSTPSSRSPNRWPWHWRHRGRCDGAVSGPGSIRHVRRRSDPADLADEALAAVQTGRFVVVPGEWRAAVVQRAQLLMAGRPPALPAPSDS